jgi:hypothetical protein
LLLSEDAMNNATTLPPVPPSDYPALHGTEQQPQSVPQSPSDAAGQAPVPGRAVSSRVAQLNIRRDGYTVTAELTCHVCCGDGRVEKPGYHVDATCGACNGKGYRVLESTDNEWIACWAETCVILSAQEVAEADALLNDLEEQAIADYSTQLDGRAYYCAGSRERPHRPLGIEDAAFRCVVCGGRAHPVVPREAA